MVFKGTTEMYECYDLGFGESGATTRKRILRSTPGQMLWTYRVPAGADEEKRLIFFEMQRESHDN